MKCPVDGDTLSIVYRNEIEIDYCPTCRGVWLDRGELDKLIERAAVGGAAGPQSAPARAAPERRGDYDDAPRYRDNRGRDDREYGGRKYKKKKGLLGEIFDFLD